MTNQTIHKSDVLIIGAGGAGLMAAIEAAKSGLSVTVATKVPPLRSHTVAAQGGINAALGNRVDDSWQWHAHDTIKGGDYLSDEDAVNFMCEHAPAAIFELESLGMAFSRDENGKIYQRAYGGQRKNFGKGELAYRACAVADRTGHALMYTLHATALKLGVNFIAECMATDLITHENICHGAFAWKIDSGELLVLQAHKTVIATGGFGQVYAETTSSSICTGDGNAMVLKAGYALQDMEFIQFHPTALYGAGVLITEGTRGEGAHLLNGNDERFLKNYVARDMELASRDLISRAIIKELQEGRGAGIKKDHVLLNLSHLPEKLIKEKLPNVLSIAQKFARVNACKEPIPVVPAVHYTMGGVASNAKSEIIGLGNAYVVGEAACNSVHGANRLGCNSLLDIVVFGKSVGSQISSALKKCSPLPSLPKYSTSSIKLFLNSQSKLSGYYCKKELKKTMSECAPILRNATTLKQGTKKLTELFDEFGYGKCVDKSLIWNNELLENIETHNLLLQAQVVLVSALAREESRGAHFREDFPENKNEFKKHSLVRLNHSGTLELSWREVRSKMHSTL